MPRMQLYLPDDLYQQVKKRKLPASELLQEAVRAAIRRQDLLDATDRYLEELNAEVGEPSAEDTSWAEEIVREVREHRMAWTTEADEGPEKRAS